MQQACCPDLYTSRVGQKAMSCHQMKLDSTQPSFGVAFREFLDVFAPHCKILLLASAAINQTF
jgi:hypothetical protein